MLSKHKNLPPKLSNFKGYVFDRSKIEKHFEFLQKQREYSQKGESLVLPINAQPTNQDPIFFCDSFDEILQQTQRMSNRQMPEPPLIEFRSDCLIFRGVLYPIILDNEFKHYSKAVPLIRILVLADFNFVNVVKNVRLVVDQLDKKPKIDGSFSIKGLNVAN